MNAESGPGNRGRLPSKPLMQTFQFAPNVANPPQANQKNYVFVDEHNRHKRLKVMRACEGCRRRKIKCDAATTNAWPCSACVRLKLHCVPPTANYDKDAVEDVPDDGPQGTLHTRLDDVDGGYRQQLPAQQQLPGPPKALSTPYAPSDPYSDTTNVYPSLSYGEPLSGSAQPNMQYRALQTSVGVMDQPQQYPTPSLFATPTLSQHPSIGSTESYEQEAYPNEDLSDLLGSLKMNEAGTAPYLNSKTKSSGEEPAFEDVDEFKNILPPTLPGSDLKIRIPPELMPAEATILHYFDIYFTDVHPYVPVLNRASFYQKWHNSRDTVSPFVLEAIFAIAGRLLDEPAQGHQWIALASKHADSFMDKPRLSTLQAMLIVLKARESAPKRGYYFRSWMTVVACVQMGKDLGLDEHYEDHKAGRPCNDNMADCVTKIRIWHTVFVCELMIGSPQGRTDLAVDLDTLDWRMPRPVQGIDGVEYSVSRNWIYFSKVVLNVRRLNDVYARVKKKKNWGNDPEIEKLGPNFDAWIKELPHDLQVRFPPDGSPPWLPSHFIGNLHSYYYLSIIMYNRPQLAFMDPTNLDGGWKHHMMLCYSSAKLLCRLQEAILQSFGMTGLLCMQRGINFTIYCVLTCTVLHLVALTSPDPDLFTDARDYFTRHMRILERCSSSWPMPDMQQQIDALREAFSADVRKPFVLKPSFPYASPRGTVLSPPQQRDSQYRQSGTNSIQQHIPTHSGHPKTPPVTADSIESRNDSPTAADLSAISATQRPPQLQQMATNMPMATLGSWNPSRIFEQWTSTFDTPPAAHIAPPATGSRLANPVSVPQEIPNSAELQNLMKVSAETTHPIVQPQYPSATIQTFVSPSMWQESVASVYEGGMKRSWDYGDDGMSNAPMKRWR